jgi:hypothetical protein
LPAALAQEVNTSVKRYVLTYISYNRIYFMLQLFYFSYK